MAANESWAIILIILAVILCFLFIVSVCCLCKTDRDCFLYRFCPLKLAIRHTKLRTSQSDYGSASKELLPIWRPRPTSGHQEWTNTSDDDVIELSVVGVKQWAASKEGTMKILPPDAVSDYLNFYRGGIVEFSIQYDKALLLNVLSVCGLVIGEENIDTYFSAKVISTSDERIIYTDVACKIIIYLVNTGMLFLGLVLGAAFHFVSTAMYSRIPDWFHKKKEAKEPGDNISRNFRSSLLATVITNLYRESSLSPLSRRLLPIADHERRTRTQRGGSFIRFNQTLQFDVDERYLKSRLALKLCLYEVDQYARHLLSGECVIDVDMAHLMTDRGHMSHVINEPLLQPKQEYLGEVKIALSYLPLAEKVIVTVVAGHCLQKGDRQKITSDVYFRVALMSGSQQLRKHRTSSCKNTNHVSVGETFTFDLPQDQLSTTYIMIAVVEDSRVVASREHAPHHETKYRTTTLISSETVQTPVKPAALPEVTLESPSSSDAALEMPSSPPSEVVSRGDPAEPVQHVTTKSVISTLEVRRYTTAAIGRAYIGSMFDGLPKMHWREMANNIRKHVTCWHKIY